MGRTTAQRAEIDPFLVMQVVAEASALEAITGDVLHLEVGQPSTGAPAAALAAAQELLRAGGALGYTEACGIDPLRRGITELYRDRHGLEIDPARVIVTAGASGALVLGLLASFDPGARVVITEPGYPCYRQLCRAFGLEAVPVRVGPESNFLITPDLLDALQDADLARGAAPIDGLVIASPANPTGTAYDSDRLAEIAAWCDRHDVRLIADEIYHGINFGDPAPTALQHGVGEIVLGSFSKYFSMTGWRIGWMVVPETLVTTIDRLSQNLYLCPPTLAQHAALAALGCGEELDRHVERYERNRDILRDALEAIGVCDIAPCDGAFYLYGSVAHWGRNSVELCDTWLYETGVATSPGVDFDPTLGADWVRWSLAGSTEDITEAARRLTAWATARHG